MTRPSHTLDITIDGITLTVHDVSPPTRASLRPRRSPRLAGHCAGVHMSTHTQCGTCGHLVVGGVCLCPQGVATVPALRAQLADLQSLFDEIDRQAVGQALEERMRGERDVTYELRTHDGDGLSHCDSLAEARHYVRQVPGCTIVRVTREVIE